MDISHISARIDFLSDALTILEGQYNDPNNEIEEKCVDIFTNLIIIKENMNALREVFEKIKEQHEIALEKSNELEILQQRIKYIKNNLPKGNTTITTDCNKPSLIMLNSDTVFSRNTVSPIPVSWSKLDSPCINQNGDKIREEINKPTKGPCKPKSYPSILYVSETEFSTVPKYMRGRLTVSILNKLVDSFNASFKKKYETIRQPKSSVKSKDIEYYREWKREENTEPKGTFFITGKDLTTFGDTKLDKGVLNMITILRHLKRIKETRQVNGPLHYVVL